MITQKQRNNKQKLALAGISIITVLAMFTMKANANKGTFIIEKFECKTEILNYNELKRMLKITPKNDFRYSIFLSEFKSTETALKAHDCKGVNYGN